MKVGLVFDDSLDRPDGIQQYILTLGSWLTNQGHEVHYLVGETNRSDIKNIYSLSKNLRVRFNKNVMTTPLPADKNKIKDVLINQKFDILHVQMPYSPLLTGRIINFAPETTAIIGTFHVAPYSAIQSFAAAILKLPAKKQFKRLNAVTSVSTVAKDFALKSMGIASVVVPNAVDAERYHQTVDDRSGSIKNVVFLGRLVERKGCQYLLEAVKKLSVDNWSLTIAGDGRLRQKLEANVKSSNMQNKVKFLGFVSEEEKAKLLASADIAVFPSTGGESFGIVLIEAMAAARGVVLAGNNPGYSSVLKDCPVALFNPQNVKEFSDILTKFITNEAEAASVTKTQKQIVKSFDIKTVGPKVLSIYKQAIAKQAASQHNKY